METLIGNQQKITVPLNPYHSNDALLYLPDDYETSGEKYPLILFVHGLGESGTDPNLLLRHGTPYELAHGWNAQAVNPVDGKTYKFICIAPQGGEWEIQGAQIDSVLKFMGENYRIDTNRIYLTGLSAGGGAVVDYMERGEFTPTYKIAACVPMSAVADPNSPNVKNIAADNVHVWGIGGDSDIHGWHTHQICDEINVLVPGLAKYSNVLPGHSDWEKVYDPNYREDGKNIYEWCLQFSLTVATVIKYFTADYDNDSVIFYYSDNSTKSFTNVLRAQCVIKNKAWRVYYNDGTNVLVK